jgi:tRNA threonylcarbamoyl adenosine modification protein YjeE
MRRPDVDVHRLATAGCSGELVRRGPWSVEVRVLTGDDPAAWLVAADRWAADAGALDLRATTPLPGFQDLVPGGAERARPVPVALPDAEGTRALGARLAGSLRPGDLVVLSGPLGAGKTTLTQGLGAALGVRGRVTSPTFVLARAHRGPLPLLHVDAYRLRDSGPVDLDDLDLDAALEDAVTVVEWGEGLVEGLAESRLEVRLDRRPPAGGSATGEGRTARVLAVGPRWAVLPPRPDRDAPGGGLGAKGNSPRA